jgi:Ala-tRNA(Pro) deacylase
MKKSIEQLLQGLDITYRWLDHPAVFTVAESSSILQENQPVKNLLLQDMSSGQTYLVIMAGDQRLDVKRLEKLVSARKLRFASAEKLMEKLGVTPGSVSVFGMLHDSSADVIVILDASLIQDDIELGFHPNDNTATIFFAAPKLVTILESLHRTYRIVELY